MMQIMIVSTKLLFFRNKVSVVNYNFIASIFCVYEGYYEIKNY